MANGDDPLRPDLDLVDQQPGGRQGLDRLSSPRGLPSLPWLYLIDWPQFSRQVWFVRD